MIMMISKNKKNDDTFTINSSTINVRKGCYRNYNNAPYRKTKFGIS